MPFEFTHNVLLPLTFGFVALTFVALGLYALARKRPFMLDGRWMLVIFVIAWSPQLIMQVSLFFVDDRYRSHGLDFMSLLSLSATAIFFGYVALQMRGYLVFGTTQDSFRETLLAALSSLGLKSEERLSSIRLPSVPAELQVAVYGWVGTGQLRLRNGGRPGLLPDIAAAMNAHFDAAAVKTNMITAIFYLVVGVLLCAMAVTMMVVLKR
jgi:hypothetical protein